MGALRVFLQVIRSEGLQELGAWIAAFLVARGAAVLGKALFRRIGTWLGRQWKRVVAHTTTVLLDLTGLTFAGGAAAGVGVLVGQLAGVGLPGWVWVLLGVLGGLFYLGQRAGLAKRLQDWASKREGR